jgi:hypothetical protein
MSAALLAAALTVELLCREAFSYLYEALSYLCEALSYLYEALSYLYEALSYFGLRPHSRVRIEPDVSSVLILLYLH